MAAKKDVAGKDKEPQVRGKSGPASQAPNEGRGKRRAKEERLPRVDKHDTGKRGSGALH